MKFKAKTADVLKSLNHAQSVAARKSTIPILTHSLMRCEDGKLSVVATDLDVGVSCSCAVDSKKDGAVAVEAKKAHEVFRSLPDKSVSVDLGSNGRLNIKSGKSKFSLATVCADEFHQMPTDALNTFEVPSDKFAKMISRTVFCASADRNRPSIAGVHMHSDGGPLRMTATDGHRLATIEELFKTEKVSALIPVKWATEAVKILKDANTAMIGFSERVGVVECGSVSLSTRLVDASFPDVDQIITKENAASVTVDRQELIDAIKRTSILGDGSGAVVLSFGKALTVSASDPELGDAFESVASDYAGDDLEIRVSARYMLDALAAIDTGRAMVEFTDSESFITMRPSDGSDFLALVMPMAAR